MIITNIFFMSFEASSRQAFKTARIEEFLKPTEENILVSRNDIFRSSVSANNVNFDSNAHARLKVLI